VDIIKNVINLVCIHWAADRLCGLPLKTKAKPGGIITEQEAYDVLSTLFICVFENLLPENGWTLRTVGKQVSDLFNKMVDQTIKAAVPARCEVSLHM